MSSFTMELDDSPRPRRSSKPTSLRSFVFGILLFLALLYTGKRASSIVTQARTFVKATNPHVAHHHQPNGTVDESQVVRSFFGPGGVETFSLVATIFFSVQEEREVGEDGRRVEWEDDEKWLPWERVFSEVVLEGLSVESKGSKVAAKVTLPAKMVPLLRNGFAPRESILLANFHLLPSSLQLPNHLVPLNATYFDESPHSPFFREARIAEGDTDVLPLPWPAVGSTVAAQAGEDKSWVALLQQHSRPFTLTKRVITQSPKATEEEEGTSINFDEVDGELEVGREEENWNWPRIIEQRVLTRSMVTLVRDYPVYSLSRFRQKQKALAASTRRCGLGISQRDCSRGFGRIGHMEYLLEMGSSSSNSSDVVVEEPSSKRWTYLPFIETDFRGGGPLDVISLPDGNIDEDFSFDWDISFSSLSPLRIALAYKYIGRPGSDGDIVVPSSPEENHRNVLRQDAAEFLNALSGHSFDNDARPLLRFSLRRLSSLLTLASFIITAHYWWSRTTTVGISTVVQVLSSLRALGFVVLSARHGTYWSFHLFFFSILAELFVVSSLCGRIEWTWGGIGGWVPVGVSRRKATHSERASSRIDATFSWTMRALLFLLFFLFAVLSLPNLPHLISASPSSPPTVGPGSHRNKNGSPVRFLTPANQSFHLVLFLSQFLLNQRSRTFAGTHKIAAALDLVSELAWNLPIMLSSRWGTWLMMDPLTPWFLLVLGAKSALAYQAWSFETVKQEDGEEEEEESSR